MDHLIDPELIQHFEWDAQKISRFDGKDSARIYMELWTGEHFWDAQVRVSKLFNFRTVLTSYKDVATRGGKNGVSQTLRRQEPALVVRNGKGVSGDGEDR